MNNLNKIVAVVFALLLLACKGDVNAVSEESIIKGELTLMVDENIAGILEEQKEIFESSYQAKINMIAKSEAEVINNLLQDSVAVVATTVTLTDNQLSHFENKKIKGKITVLGFDAIVLISNKAAMDSIVDYNEIQNLFDKKNTTIKGMVFSNPNTSNLSFLSNKFNADIKNNTKIFSLDNQISVLEYISKNPGYIGAISLYDYLHTSAKDQVYKENIQRLNVKIQDQKTKKIQVVNADKSFLANNLYPFRRPIYLLNYQGKSGLGMGFASFAAGDIGQLIIDKANLLPVRIPPREINVRNEILK